MSKPSEVKLIAEILEQDAPTAVDMAKRVLSALEAKRRDERELVLLAYPQPDSPHVVGPFATPLQARKAITAGLVDGYCRPVWLYHAASLQAQYDEQQDVQQRGWCASCKHPRLSHIDKRWKPQGTNATWRPAGCMHCACKETWSFK